MCMCKSCFLNQLNPLSDLEDCQICCEPIFDAFATTCKHSCRQYLHARAGTSSKCHTCRNALYFEDDDRDYNVFSTAGSEDDAEDSGDELDEDVSSITDSDDEPEIDFSTDPETARALALNTGLITTTFQYDREKVLDHLTLLIQHDSPRNPTMSGPGNSPSFVKVIYSTLLTTTLAHLLYLKPRRGESVTCHRPWERVAEAWNDVLKSHDGSVVTAAMLYQELVDVTIYGECETRYDISDYGEGVKWFAGCYWEDHVYQLARAVMRAARLEYGGGQVI